jgi:hypothetical protein
MRVLAVLVLVAGFLVVWGGFTQPDVPDDVCPTIREGQGYTYETQWWPPGTVECVVTGAGDDVVATRTNLPWRDYLTVVLFALAIAVFGFRPTRMLASLAFLLAALAVFFVGFDP